MKKNWYDGIGEVIGKTTFEYCNEKTTFYGYPYYVETRKDGLNCLWALDTDAPDENNYVLIMKDQERTYEKMNQLEREAAEIYYDLKKTVERDKLHRALCAELSKRKIEMGTVELEWV